MRKQIYFTTIILVVSFTHAAPCEDISLPEIIQGYHENARLFENSRIIYLMQYSLIPNANKQFIPAQTSFLLDCWTDGENILLRWGDYSESKRNHLVGFQSVNVSSQELNDYYTNTYVGAYHAKDGVFRFWQGYENGASHPIGTIRKKVSYIDRSQFRFPPFMSFGTTDETKLFPGDAFFSSPTENIVILGKQRIGDDEMIVLERKQTDEEFIKSIAELLKGTEFEGKNIEYNDFTTAWVNPRKGYIPVQICEWSAFCVDGQFANGRERDRFPEMETCTRFQAEEIKELPGGGYYPCKAQKELFLYETPDDFRFSSPLEVLRGATFDFPIKIYDRFSWEVFSVQKNADVTEDTLQLPFPEGTLVVDENGKNSIVGMSDEEYQEFLRKEMEKGIDSEVYPLPRHDNFKYRRVLFVVGINFVVISFLLVHWYHKKKSQ
jgi:hypothetical protein